MRWLVNYIRSCFCKHEWEYLQNRIAVYTNTYSDIPEYYQWIYRCKKCGCKNIIKS